MAAPKVMSGFSAVLYIGGGADDVGVATNVAYNEDFRLNPIEVLNHYGPLEHKSVGWQCSITTGILILDDMLERDIQKTAQKGLKGPEDVLATGLLDIEVQNNVTRVIKDKFTGCRTASKNVTYTANALVTGGATWMALGHTQGTKV